LVVELSSLQDHSPPPGESPASQSRSIDEADRARDLRAHDPGSWRTSAGWNPPEGHGPQGQDSPCRESRYLPWAPSSLRPLRRWLLKT